MSTKNSQAKMWKQTFNIDKRQIQSFNKDIGKLFAFSTTITPWNQLISKMLRQSQQKQALIDKQQKKAFKKLQQINQGVSQLKETLKYYEHTNQFLVKVQNLSKNTFQKIDLLKQSMSHQFQELIDIQDNLEADLKIYQNKIQTITSSQYEYHQQENKLNIANKENRKVQSAKSKQRAKQKIEEQQKPQRDGELDKIKQYMSIVQEQVDEIQAKINALGKNLGWIQDDHNDFIKIWNRCNTKNYFDIEDQMNNFFKLYTQQQIKEHMNKYIKFKNLTEEKKEKISKYKEIKEQKKQKEFQLLVQEEAIKKNKQKRKENLKRSEQEQQKMKQQLQEWKKQKQQKKIEEQKRLQEEQEKQMMQKHKRMIELNMKKQVLNQWKEQQQELRLAQLKQSNATKKSSITIDKQTQERIRQRQQRIIRQKIEQQIKKKQLQEQKILKEQKLKEKKYVKYSHVNSKLEQKTTAIKEKQRQKFDGKNKKQANTFGGNLLMHGMRATPAWMSGL